MLAKLIRGAAVARAGAGLCLLLVASLAAAQPRPQPQAPRAVPVLTDSDRADMKAIARQIGRTPYGELDLADPLHYRYLKRNLELGGLAAADYPMLFKSIEESRRRAVSRRSAGKYARGRLLVAPASSDDEAVVPVVNILALGPIPDNSGYLTTVQLSVPDSSDGFGAPIAQTSIGLYDQNGNALGLANSQTQYNGGWNVINTVFAQMSTPVTTLIVQGTYQYADPDGTVHHGAIYAVAEMPAPARAAALTGGQTINNIAPTDVKGDNIIKVCVVRADADCDYLYSAVGGQFIVKFPIQANVTFPVTLLPASQQPSGQVTSFSITRTDPNTGGACTLPANFNFWSGATINGNVLSWIFDPGPFSNPTGANNPCFPSGSNVVYNAHITVYGVDNNPYTAIITTAQPQVPPPNTAVLWPMVVVYGCVAEGSLVTLADGRSAPIQTIKAGDRIRGADGRLLVVNGVTSGFEREPMVRIVTDDGRSLLLTETHPVMSSAGPVMAKHLAPGTIVFTEGGASALRSVAREKGDRVWNLALASTDSKAALPDDPAFFANGVLVGDSRSQQRAELRERDRLAQRRLQSIPAAWRKDAESARRREAARAGAF